jgi:REP element-mobilizing transposase RayT
MVVEYHAKLEEENFYHIYNRTNGKDLLYLSDNNYVFFLEKFKQYICSYCDVYAYCLMSNHFHFIVQVKKSDEKMQEWIIKEGSVASEKQLLGEITLNEFLEDQFKRFFNSYAAAFNKQQKRHGSLFQKRFKRVLISSEDILKEKICYVHHNPIHHGMSSCYDVWRYSSYLAYLSTKETLVCREKGLYLFDENAAITVFINQHEIYQKNRLI